MRTLLDHITDQLLDIQHGKLWIGSNFDRKLDTINEEDAFDKPIENLHSVAEIISHRTLWRKETILKIKTGKGSKTDDCPENWLSNDLLKSKGWNKIKSDYDQTLIELINLLQNRDDNFLNEMYYDTDFKGHFKYEFVINGMIHHDIYHLGQLGIIMKFLKIGNRLIYSS